VNVGSTLHLGIARGAAVAGALIMALSGMLSVAVPALAQGPPAPPSRPWTENFDYTVEVNGAISPSARLFNAKGRPAMLLMCPELGGTVVIDLQQRQVRQIPVEAFRELPEGAGIEVAEGAVEGAPAPYTMDGETVIFYWEGKRAKIIRKPPMVGEVTLDELLARLPIYRKGMDAYDPPTSDVSYLKGYELPVKVHVFFGSWCPHCRQTVPRFLKSLEAAGNDHISLAFTGVPPQFREYPPARDKQVKGVPTFIVYDGDREIGRFSAIPEGSSTEHELVKILFAHAQEKG
jgi:thiol-disulfide isomerase/thioredoxin